MVVKATKCPRCGKVMLIGHGCSHCAGGGGPRNRSGAGPVGPIITFILVFAGLYGGAEALLADKGPLAPLLLVVGCGIVMRIWQIGYWHDDGQPILQYLGAQSLLGDLLGTLATPGRLIWFWTTDRPYFRACFSAVVGAGMLFMVIHVSLYATSGGS